MKLDIIRKYFSRGGVGRMWVLSLDTLASVLSSVLIYWCINIYILRNIVIYDSLSYIIGLFFISLISVLLGKTYIGVVKYFSFNEMWRIVYASLLKAVTIVLVIVFFKVYKVMNYSLSIILIIMFVDIMINIFLLVIIRFVANNLYWYLFKGINDKSKNIIIYGDDGDAVSALSALQRDSRQLYSFKGFIVYGNIKSKKSLCGYNLMLINSDKSFIRYFRKKNTDSVLFTNTQIVRDEKYKIIPLCVKNNIEVLIRPRLSHITENMSLNSNIREVKIEDLLAREEVNINIKKINALLNDKVVMVTGACGSIGSQICRELLNYNLQKLILVDNAETPMHNMQLELRNIHSECEKQFIITDVRMKNEIEYVFKRYSPNIIFHAAAYKHVPMMELNPCEAINVNVFGTKILADLAVQYKVEKFVMISTDKAVNPTNVMGASKRLAEIYVQSLSSAIIKGDVIGSTKFVTTRFGNILGSSGSVIPLFRKQIKKGGPVTVTDTNVVRYFMTISEACKLVLEAAAIGKENEIFVFDRGRPVKILNLAKNMIDLAGLKLGEDIDIDIIGLRHGEKVYEEFLSNKETTNPTSNNKIFITTVRKYDYAKVCSEMDYLFKVSNTMKRGNTVASMKKLIPEFKS
ncbi:MAG: nucleoside-diphosphate sugar epimerase/dehydratase [Bacteroidales bacterium]